MNWMNRKNNTRNQLCQNISFIGASQNGQIIKYKGRRFRDQCCINAVQYNIHNVKIMRHFIHILQGPQMVC